MAGELVGKTLGQYELRAQIGRGGMASVYQAYQPSIQREVAIKILPPYLTEQAGYLERFEREVRITAALEHPAILPVYDYGTEDGVTYIVMRVMPGGSLSARLAKLGKPTPGEALRLLEQIASGLDYAHRRGVVHRDLKPGNILFDTEGNAFLSDFGVAELTISDPNQVSREFVGTPAYAAPEQLQDGTVSAKSDLYALGIVVYELLVGELPFTGDPMAIIVQHVQKPLPKDRLHPAVYEVLARMTAKSPDSRYINAQTFLNDLREALQLSGADLTLPPGTPFLTNPAWLNAPPAPILPDKKRAPEPPRLQPAAPAVYPPMQSAAPRKSGGVSVLWLVMLGIAVLGIGLLINGVFSGGTGGNILLPLIAGAIAIAIAFAAGSAGIVTRRETHSFPPPQGDQQAQHPKPSDTLTAPIVTAPSTAPLLIPQPTQPEPTSVPTVSYHTLKSGDALASYQIKARLDKGDRSRVFHAFDEARGRDVAIKCMNAEFDTETRAARFKREAQLLGRLHHAHIVPFFDFGSHNDMNYIVMPLLSGGSLARRLEREGRLLLPDVLDILDQLAGALDYLHNKGVIHRDLKPSNLVFDDQDNIYLADLGIAKVLDDTAAAQLTQAGQMLGTPSYMPPEQWTGEGVTPAADQYALACIVYQVLTGELPFTADAPFALMLKHVRDTPPLLTALRPDLPPALDVALLKALEKNPSDRYLTVRDFAAALRAAAYAVQEEALPQKKAGHVFISYSRTDGDYAYKLADHLRGHGLEVWIDSRIEPSDSWWRSIVEAIEGCGAFVVLMTPAAEESKWVEREVLLADQKNKPAFPILLKGNPFPIYVSTQHTPITGDVMPPELFITRLRGVLKKG